MTTVSVEYNKIHALAQARRKVIAEYGSDLLYFWPLGDGSYYIRDLLRQRSLVAASPVSMQAPGLVDYGADLGDQGYISDVVKNQGGIAYSALGIPTTNDWYLAVPIPVGRWTGVKFRQKDGSGHSPAAYVAQPGTNPSSVSGSALFSVNSTTSDLAYTFVEQTTTGTMYAFYGAYRQGQKANMGGKIDRVWFYLDRWGNPSGAIYCKIYRASDGTLLATASNTVDASSVNGWCEWQFNGYDIGSAIDIRIVLEFPTGDGSNCVRISHVGSDVCTGVATQYNGSVWSDLTGMDASIKVYRVPPQHTVTFPFTLDADADQWWLYLKGNTFNNAAVGSYGTAGKLWGGSSWSDCLRVLAEFQGADAPTWSAYDDFTIGMVVDAGASPANGVLLAIADASEVKAQVFLKSDKKIEGRFKNANGSTYTLTSLAPLHPGFNLITLSYDRNAAVKLGINGKVVATDTPSDHAMFAASTFATCIGAQMLTGKTLSNYAEKVVVDDVWLAKGVVTDAMLWEIYLQYITGAPLMLTTSV